MLTLLPGKIFGSISAVLAVAYAGIFHVVMSQIH